jgi:hypothetical protein
VLNKLKAAIFLTAIVTLAFNLSAQQIKTSSTELTVEKRAGRKVSSWDTTRYQKFRSNLIVGLFQTYRNFNNQFKTVKSTDSNAVMQNYYAESDLVTGVELNYDKFSLSLGLRSKPQKNSEGKGNTKTASVNFNFGGNTWFVENSFRSFTGFYDASTPLYDSSFRETGTYKYLPNFTNLLFRSKFLFFTNHKRYSFRSNYVCNYRQLKTGGSWIMSANTNFNYLHNDSSFFPAETRDTYRDHATMRGLRVFGISANGGGAFTLVLWRAFFAHVMFILGPEQQWRSYEYLDKPTKNLSYLSVSGDIRGSIGLNFKRAYVLWTTINDFVLYDSSFMALQNKSLTGSFIFGWRFNSRTPEFYKKIQKTKLYLAL